MVGTGFFISPNTVVTCAHVILCHAGAYKMLNIEGAIHETNPRYEEILQSYFHDEQFDVHVETPKGERLKALRVSFDGGADAALIDIEEEGMPLHLEEKDVQIGEDIMTLGFPYTIQMKDEEFPFAANKGYVISYPTVVIGGYVTRRFMQIFCPSMGGASGSPIFDGDGHVVAMLNGQMRWGDDHFMFMENGKTVVDALHVPLPYGFCTPIKSVMDAVQKID